MAAFRPVYEARRAWQDLRLMTRSEALASRPLVFDLDGTLIDSRRDIAEASNFALEAMGRKRLSVEEICRFVGSGAAYLLENVAGAPMEVESFRELLEHFSNYYELHPTDFSTVLPGAEAALRSVDRKIAICTNKPAAITRLVVENLGWTSLVDLCVGAGDFQKKKPDKEPLTLVAQRLEVPASSLVMIGDSPQDVLAGHAVGAHTILVRGGFLPEEQGLAARPHGVLSSLEELPAYLEKHAL